MFALVKTLFQICLLKKGPEAIPPSPIFFVYAVFIWIVTVMLTIAFIETFTAEDARIAALSSALALVIYYFTLLITRKTPRVIPTLTAMLGCGSLISVAMVITMLTLSLVSPTSALIVAQLLLFWSVPVKGHILARALGVHWYAGIAIAIAVFVIQYSLSVSLTPEL